MSKDKARKRDLRTQAEARLAAAGEALPMPSVEDAQALFHELQVHQLDLEMQNEVLQRTKQELTEATDRYVYMYDFAPVGYVMTREDDIIFQVNLPFTGMVGLERSKLIDKPLSFLVASKDRDAYDLFRKAAIDSGEKQSTELRINKADGDMFWGLIECIAMPDIEQGSGNLLITVSDITEIKLEAEKFQGVTESVHDAIIMLDHEGKITLWNNASEDIFGYAASEVMGKALHYFLAPQRFRAGFEKAFPIFLKTGQGEAIDKPLELAALHKDGHEFPVELSLSALFRHDKWNAVGIVRDISERKRTEQNMLASKEEIARQNRIAEIFLANPDEEIFGKVLEVIIEAMDSKLGVFGYLDEDENLVIPSMSHGFLADCQVSGKSIVFPRDTWGDSAWPRAIREKKANYSNELSTKTPEGHIPILRSLALPIMNQGRVIGLLNVANKETDYDEQDV